VAQLIFFVVALSLKRQETITAKRREHKGKKEKIKGIRGVRDKVRKKSFPVEFQKKTEMRKNIPCCISIRT
jgi:hypothetical protein